VAHLADAGIRVSERTRCPTTTQLPAPTGLHVRTGGGRGRGDQTQRRTMHAVSEVFGSQVFDCCLTDARKSRVFCTSCCQACFRTSACRPELPSFRQGQFSWVVREARGAALLCLTPLVEFGLGAKIAEFDAEVPPQPKYHSH